jgi:hypothetical protein
LDEFIRLAVSPEPEQDRRRVNLQRNFLRRSARV